jgi:hypothetical protein
MDVFQADGILDRQHWVPVCRLTIDEALLESDAEERQAVAAAEMAVEAIQLLVFDHQLVARVPFCKVDGSGAEGGVKLGVP